MITCKGLVVGSIESANPQDLVNQCAKWLKKYKHLLDIPGLSFNVEGIKFFTVLDTFEENGEVFIYCKSYDGFVYIGTSK